MLQLGRVGEHAGRLGCRARTSRAGCSGSWSEPGPTARRGSDGGGPRLPGHDPGGMSSPEAFQALGISVGLGLLIGLQRERAGSRIAGFRTSTLITPLRTLAGLLAQTLGAWLIVGGPLGVVALLSVANLIRLRGGEIAPGMTTEVAALVMYCVGAYLVFGHRSVAL